MYDIDGKTIQLNHVAFIPNKLGHKLLWIRSNSSAIIQNNTLIENSVLRTVYDIEKKRIIQVKNVAFIRNKLKSGLLSMESNSSAIMRNSTMKIIAHGLCTL